MENTEEKKPAKLKVRIKRMGDRYATGGVNLAPGAKGKLKPDDVCEISRAEFESMESILEETKDKVNSRLENNAIIRQ